MENSGSNPIRLSDRDGCYPRILVSDQYRSFQDGLEICHKASSNGAIDYAVVCRQGHAHDRVRSNYAFIIRDRFELRGSKR